MKTFKALVLVIILVFTITSCGSSPAETESATPASTEVTQEQPEPQANYIEPGMYKVGVDLPAGEYLITGEGYGELTSDSTGQLECIITNNNYVYSWYIAVKDGEYLSFSDGSCYPIAEAPALDLNGEGMFKVGRDIAAGEYKITSDSDAYSEVASSSRGGLNDIVSNNNFVGDQYITIADGQYLKLVNCYIIQ